MFHLPNDIIKVIYQYDPTYHLIYCKLKLEFLNDYKYLESILNVAYSTSNEPFYKLNLIKKEFYFFRIFDKVITEFLFENRNKLNYKFIKKFYRPF